MNKKWYSILSALLVTGFVIITTTYAIRTKATENDRYLDLSRQMSVTVEIPDSFLETEPEIKGELVYDFYRVADLVPEGNGFSYHVTDQFQSMKEILLEQTGKQQGMEASDFEKLAQEAVKCFQISPGSVWKELSLATCQEVTPGTKTNVDPGLYLILGRSRDENATYLMEMTKESAEGTANGETQLVTEFRVGQTKLSSAPILVTVPGKEQEDGSFSYDTAVNGKWIYDWNLQAKLTTKPACGSIEIEKTLDLYFQDAENAIFVFQADTYYPNENTLYSSEVYSISFEGPGTKKVLVEGLPIGAIVKVKEIYHGINYKPVNVSQEPQTVTVQESFTNVVHFDNTYDEKTGGGGGITNHFTYKQGEESAEWTLTQTKDNTETQNGNE